MQPFRLPYFTVDRIVRYTLSAALLVGLMLVLRSLSSVLIPFVVAMLAAYLLDPLVRLLTDRLHMRRGPAAIVVFAGILIACTGLLWWIVPMFVGEFERFSVIVSRTLESLDTPENRRRLTDLIARFNLESIVTVDNIVTVGGELLPRISNLAYTTAAVLSDVTSIAMALLYTVFLMCDFPDVKQKLKRLIPQRHKRRAGRIGKDIVSAANTYFRAQGTISLIVGVMLAAGFAFTGLPLGIVMGLLMGVLNMVPYLQLAGIPVVLLLALLRCLEAGTGFWQEALPPLAVMAVVQIVQETVLNPRIMGKAYSLSPAFILLALSVWGSLLGVLGMMIALPLTAVIITYAKEYLQADDNGEQETPKNTTLAGEHKTNDEMEENNMREAIRLAMENIDNDGGPFGAVVVKDGQMVGRGCNRVTANNDPTAHAEVMAIRDATSRLGTFDLSSCEIYTSCEPCPMCLGAIYWARISRIHYGCTQADAARIDFDDSFIYRQIERPIGRRSIPEIQSMHPEAIKVFEKWAAKDDKTPY